MRPPARHAATCWVAAVRRNDQLEDISFCFMGSVHTVVYVRFPFPVLVLSFPKKRPPCRLNHPTEHPAFLFFYVHFRGGQTMGRPSLVVATLLLAAAEAMVGHGPAAMVGHGPSANGSRARCSPSEATRRAVAAPNIWQGLDEPWWQAADDSSGQASAVAGVEHSRAVVQSAAALLSDSVLTVPTPAPASKYHRQQGSSYDDSWWQGAMVATALACGAVLWRSSKSRARRARAHANWARMQAAARRCSVKAKAHKATSTIQTACTLMVLLLGANWARMQDAARQRSVKGKAHQAASTIQAAARFLIKWRVVTGAAILLQAIARGLLVRSTLRLLKYATIIVQRATRSLLVQCRQESSAPKQSTPSGCSTPPKEPAQQLVDRPTKAAEDGASHATEPTTATRSKTARQARKRGGRNKAKHSAQHEATASENEPWPTCWVLNLTSLFRLMKPMPDFGADKMRALAKVLRQRALRLAAYIAPARQPHPLNIVGPALMAETEAHGNGERKADEPYGTTPLLRFLGAYLKKVEAAGNALVRCDDDKYSAFAACVNYRPPRFTLEANTLFANMCAAGIVSAAGAEDDDRFGEGDDRFGDSDDDDTLVDAPRRRLTRAEYDAGLGDSDDFDGASDDEAYIHNPADHAPPSLVGSVASRG